MLIDGLELWELLVDNCDVFISCWDSHSDGTHSLHWWASVENAKFLQIFSELIYISDGLRVSKCLANFHFWVNYSYKRHTAYVWDRGIEM